MAEHTKKIHFLSGGTEKTAQLYTSHDVVLPIDGNGQLVSDYPALCVQDGNSTVYAGLVDPLDSNASNLHCTHDGTEYAVAESIPFASLSPVLNENSPEQIQYAAQNDLAGLLWDIGDYFEMTLNGNWQCVDNTITLSNYVVRCVLIGINHNADKEGNHLLHFQMGENTDNVDIAFGSSKMNTKETNSGGWKSCQMRTITMNNLYNTIIPSNWRAVIKPCTKYTDNTGGGSDNASYVTATSDSCFLLAEYEVFGSRTYANSAEQNYQKQYAYYANGNSKVRYIHDSPTTAYRWWERSVLNTRTGYFCYVEISGTADWLEANRNYCFSPAFCIG
jgi:hypothetical protein